MNICVFEKYKVHLINKYDYITDREFGETSFATEKEEWTKEMNGGELIDMIAEYMLLNNETIDIMSSDKFIHISHFNPMNGTGAEIHIEYEEIKEQRVRDIFTEEFTQHPGRIEHEPISQEIKLNIEKINDFADKIEIIPNPDKSIEEELNK